MIAYTLNGIKAERVVIDACKQETLAVEPDERKITLKGALRLAGVYRGANVSPFLPSDPALDLAVAVLVGALYRPMPILDVHDVICVGAVAFDGSIRPVRGLLPRLLQAHAEGFRTAIVPQAQWREASRMVRRGWRVLAASTLNEALTHIHGGTPMQEVREVGVELCDRGTDLDLECVPDVTRRALTEAVQSGRNIVLAGPAGSHRTMFARRVTILMPVLNAAEEQEAACIYSAAGVLPESGYVTRRPFRAPHHTVSDAGMFGGGKPRRPGEVDLARHGVLYFDELVEFRRSVLEQLRTTLDDISYDSTGLIVASTLLCPCGARGSARECRCSTDQLRRYGERLEAAVRCLGECVRIFT